MRKEWYLLIWFLIEKWEGVHMNCWVKTRREINMNETVLWFGIHWFSPSWGKPWARLWCGQWGKMAGVSQGMAFWVSVVIPSSRERNLEFFHWIVKMLWYQCHSAWHFLWFRELNVSGPFLAETGLHKVWLPSLQTILPNILARFAPPSAYAKHGLSFQSLKVQHSPIITDSLQYILNKFLKNHATNTN